MLTLKDVINTLKRVWQKTPQGDAPFTEDELWGTVRSALKRRERQKLETAWQQDVAAKLVGR